MNQAIPPSVATLPDGDRAVAMGRQVLEIEAAAVAALGRRLNGAFSAAVAGWSTARWNTSSGLTRGAP